MDNSALRKMLIGLLGRRPSLRLRHNTWWLVGFLLTLAVILLVSACGTPQAEQDTAATTPAIQPKSVGLPSWVVNGSEKAQASYMVATLRAAELAYIPCYCSCGQFGHDSVIDCFISGIDSTGAIVYDNHAYY